MWIPKQMWAWFLMGMWLQKGVKAACTMAQFPCRNQQCISLDKYCDGKRDCNDGSDEPTGCSPCNRTYYGRVGATYKLKVPKPARGSLPHFCQLTFMASGAHYGDLVQISIEKFNLGRFISHTTNGCPDGYMQIEELSRPSNTGYWCGSSWGHNTYYSETSSVSLMIRVFNLSEQTSLRPLAMPSEDNILLELSYRFLIQEKAVLRYGVPYGPSFLGEDVTGTFCDKLFEDCNRKNCKIQSPNYPGMYPRNLTCYYHIKQTNVPKDKVSLVSVRQKNPHLIYIKDRNAPHLSRDVRFQLKDSCHVIHDYLVIYDGNSTKDPILLKACKGGALSPVTSSGSEMLILFHVSPYDFPFQDAPRRKVFGFQLQVDVLMVARESTAYVRHHDDTGRLSTFYPSSASMKPYSCQWKVDSRVQRSGYLQAPIHSILPNTTCTWRLLADPSEIVWLYFLHYRHVKHSEMPNQSTCPNILTVYDGDNSKGNATLLGNFCKKNRFPRVCSGVHASGAVGAAAPCSPSESYVSITPALTINLRYKIGTIPSHIEFLARYEFVDKRQWGDPTPNANECDRTFKLRPNRSFASPRDIFLFGRGGNRALSCVYKFKVAHHQRIQIKISNAKIGRTCRTVLIDSSKRHECSHGGGNHLPSIKIQETIWEGVELNRACLCNVSEGSVFSVRSYTNEMRIVFNIPEMSASEDFNDYYFEGTYEVIEAKKELMCSDEDRRHIGNHGNFSIGTSNAIDVCRSLPRIVNAQDGAFLYMKAQGFRLGKRSCDVQSRINIYGVGKAMPLVSVCPSISEQTAYVFSNGWDNEKFESHGYLNTLGFYGQATRNLTGGYWAGRNTRRRSRFIPGSSVSRDLIIEYTGNTSGNFILSWVGVWKPLRTSPLSSVGADLCPHQCPEIEACLPQELWCDGTSHCPSEIDEGASACGILTALPWVSLAVVLALITSLLILLAAVMRHRKQVDEVRRKSIDVSTVQNNGHGIKSATTEEFLIPSDSDSTW